MEIIRGGNIRGVDGADALPVHCLFWVEIWKNGEANLKGNGDRFVERATAVILAVVGSIPMRCYCQVRLAGSDGELVTIV